LNIFNEVKSRADMRSVALQYGFTPNRSGFICCPFHCEKTASMKLYERDYHCFGCGAHGDAVAFVKPRIYSCRIQ
jgi:DNA primase